MDQHRVAGFGFHSLDSFDFIQAQNPSESAVCLVIIAPLFYRSGIEVFARIFGSGELVVPETRLMDAPVKGWEGYPLIADISVELRCGEWGCAVPTCRIHAH